MDFKFSEREELLRKSMREFAEKEIPPRIRVYKCSACGLVMERTYNSALNIEAKAFRE